MLFFATPSSRPPTHWVFRGAQSKSHSFAFSLLSLFLLFSLTACAQESKYNTGEMSAISTTQPNTPTLPAPQLAIINNKPFSEWLAQLITDAKRKGISEDTINSAKPYLTTNTRVLAFDQQQPEFTQTFWTYLDKRLSEVRVQMGKIKSFTQQELLQKIEQKQGVHGEILLAFWGLETNYGHYLGDFSTLEALTTLAYDTRRSDFFRKELLAALTILQQGHVKASDMRGSWAGAIGHMQFMPSVYVKHAIDADQDQRIDLWHSTADALTSAAIYLRAAGWQPNQPWLQQVSLPKDMNYALADGKSEWTISQLTEMGIKPLNTNWLADNLPVSLLLPAGYDGPAFVVWPNFKVIKRWNSSNNYALAVGLLAHRLKGHALPALIPPKNAKPWSREFIMRLQDRLNQLGFDTGGCDGWYGSKTTQALRLYQQQQQLPADGYPNEPTLSRLQLTP
jgi:membrane-bound lytic murein transglycosylase B